MNEKKVREKAEEGKLTHDRSSHLDEGKAIMDKRDKRQRGVVV